MKTLVALLLYCMYAVTAMAQINTYTADSLRQIHNMDAYTHIMVDPHRKHNDATIAAGKADSLFIPYVAAKNKFAATEYWMLCRIKTITPFENWQLVLKDEKNFNYNSANDFVDVYVTNGSGKIIGHRKTGVLIPASKKQEGYPAGYNGVSFSADVDETLSIYVKVKNLHAEGAILSYMSLQHSAVPSAAAGFKILLPALSAIAGIFCLLSFCFFLFIREKAYLVFSLYTLVLSQHYLILHPDIPFIDIYVPEYPHLAYGFWLLFTMGGFMLFCLFGRYFMNLPKLSKTTDRWYMYFIAVASSVILAGATYEMATGEALSIEKYVSIVIIPVAIGFFIRFALFKNILARLYVGGAIWLFVFTIIGLNWGNELAPFLNPWPVGQVGQLLIFTIALAYKVRLSVQAKAEADRIKGLDEIKSRFFANISHEFRTPLSLIQAPLQQIEEQSSQKDGLTTVPYRHIKTMRKHTDRLLELVNQLLDLSKLDSGKMKLQVIKADVMQLLKTNAASFESVAERKQIHYHVYAGDTMTIAFIDKDKLEKIFINLLGNAFKYTPAQGSVSVTAGIEDNRLRIIVEDNGPGISKKELDKVFDRFFQAEGNEDKGTGIGLALVKELVDLYRGQISVSSEPAKGSRFRVTLPCKHDAFEKDEFVYGTLQQDNLPVSRYTDEAEDITTIPVNANTHLPLLLLVEDNNDLRQFMTEMLQSHYQVLQAVNGKDGFEKAVAEIPDIIVSDVMMPLMNGFDLSVKLKEDERTSHIPVILLTAKAGHQHKMEGLQTGADDYLTKPVDTNELLQRTFNLINQRKLLRKKFAGNILLKTSEVSVKTTDEIFLQKLMQAIEAHIEEENFGVEELAKEMTMSRSQLHRKLIAIIGKTASEIIRNTRLLRAKELLIKKAFSPSEVAFKVGFNSHTYFSKCFKEEFGVSPSEINR